MSKTKDEEESEDEKVHGEVTPNQKRSKKRPRDQQRSLAENESKRHKRAVPSPTPEKPVSGHPYGCGACPERYDTMVQLRDHLKELHPALTLEKPFRCAGCHRIYKNINGLKYHVNVSMVDGAHLESVRARGRPSKAPEQPPSFIDNTPEELHGSLDHLAALATAAVGEGPDGQPLEPVPPRDPFWCPMNGCGKQYKQLAGLRYHLSNGHTPQPTIEELRALNPELASRISGRGDAYPKLLNQKPKFFEEHPNGDEVKVQVTTDGRANKKGLGLSLLSAGR